MSKSVLLGAVAVVALTVGASATASADQIIYWTNFGANQLMKTDVTTHTTTVLETTTGPGQPDSLIFDNSGHIVYSDFTRNCCAGSPGSVRSFANPGADTLVKSGFTQEAVDLALDPGGATVLLADRNDEGGGAGHIQRINLTTGATTALTALTYVDGIAYNYGNGNLYANAGALGSQKVVQINPTTGAIINTGDATFNSSFLDGLTYDPFSNLLYAANGGCLQTFDPTTLKAGACVGAFNSIDGVESDAAGNILVADVGAGEVGNYNITTKASTYLFVAPGLDDIAPVAGGGAPPPVPEPGTLALLGAGLAGLGWARWRRHNNPVTLKG